MHRNTVMYYSLRTRALGAFFALLLCIGSLGGSAGLLAFAAANPPTAARFA